MCARGGPIDAVGAITATAGAIAAADDSPDDDSSGRVSAMAPDVRIRTSGTMLGGMAKSLV